MRQKLATIVVALSATFAISPATAAPTVELELATEKNFPIEGSQQWYSLLTDAGISGLRIRSQQPGDKVAIDVGGSKQAPVYRVTGTLTSRSMLIVPGGQFQLSDKAAIAKWLTNLRDNGPEGVTRQKAAFGLTPSQLTELHKQLAAPVDFATRGQRPEQVLARLKQKLSLQVTVETAIAKAMAADDPVRDELQGITSGTALAALMRPVGGIVVPNKPAGGETSLLLTTATPKAESWPIGLPPDDEHRKLVPMLFEFLDVEIEDFTVAEAAEALQGRLKLPMLFDHNAMAMHQVEPTQIKVSLPRQRTYYSRALQLVLNKAGLKSELRVDEAGKPFFWITTLKPLQ